MRPNTFDKFVTQTLHRNQYKCYDDALESRQWWRVVHCAKTCMNIMVHSYAQTSQICYSWAETHMNIMMTHQYSQTRQTRLKCSWHTYCAKTPRSIMMNHQYTHHDARRKRAWLEVVRHIHVYHQIMLHREDVSRWAQKCSPSESWIPSAVARKGHSSEVIWKFITFGITNTFPQWLTVVIPHGWCVSFPHGSKIFQLSFLLSLVWCASERLCGRRASVQAIVVKPVGRLGSLGREFG